MGTASVWSPDITPLTSNYGPQPKNAPPYLPARHYAAVLGLLLYFGDTRIIPYVFSPDEAEADEYSVIGNDIGIFEDSTVHEIEVIMSDEDHENMIATYKEAKEKDYYRVDVIIDGQLVEDVGIRLKGNLTLNTALGTMDRLREEDMDAAMRQRMEEQEADTQEQINAGELPEGFVPQNGMPFPGNGQNAGGPGGGFGGGQVPYLLKFDKYIDGQTYQGYTEIAIRTGDDAQMAEQVAYYAHRTVGQIVPQTSYAAVTINGETLLYSLAEHIDDSYLERNFENSDGVLYKAGNFVQFEYLGDDPTLYVDSFEQKTNNNEDDLTYLINFLKYVTESSDEDFERYLGSWLDLDSFITMMALDNMLNNNDSFVGMGSNFYLYYDKAEEKFYLLSWDLNMALSSGMGGGMNGNNGNMRPNIDQVNLDELPDDVRQRIEARQQAMANGDMPAMPQGGQQNGGPGKNASNVLKDRFFANQTFNAMYEERYQELYEQIFGTDLLLNKVKQLSDAFTAYNQEHAILDQEAYQAGVDSIASFIKQKMEQPAKTTTTTTNE